MSTGRTAAIATGYLASLALGIAVGAFAADRYMQNDSQAVAVDPTTAVAAISAPPTDVPAPLPRRVRAEVKPAVEPVLLAPAVTVGDPALHARVRRLLRPGANMGVVSEGFSTAEDLAATAHAAQNLNVPFMLLKSRVVEQRQTLTTAIKELRPEVNASVEADRARAEARSDLASLN